MSELFTSFAANDKRNIQVVYARSLGGFGGVERLKTRPGFMKKPIAVLGPHYSYSHLSLIETFPDCQPLFCYTITEVFEKVIQGEMKQGWVAIKNSLQGDVEETTKALQRFKVTIIKTYDFPIHHCLASRSENFQIIASHPQALKQCSKFLKQYPKPTYSILETNSTSAAMELAAKVSDYAAIGHSQASKHYGLKIIYENIEDDPGNSTQFGLIEVKK